MFRVPDDASDDEIRGILSRSSAPTQRAGGSPGGAPMDQRFRAPMPATAATSTNQASGAGQDAGNSLARRLGMSLGYAVQQDPDKYARLLRIQKLTGIPPIVSKGREKEIEQMLDARRIDPHAFTAVAPRTAVWASNPDNAAVAGVSEIQRLGGVEQNAAVMRAAALHAAAMKVAMRPVGLQDAAESYAVTATNPDTQHQIGTNDGGRTWHVAQTGERVY